MSVFVGAVTAEPGTAPNKAQPLQGLSASAQPGGLRTAHPTAAQAAAHAAINRAAASQTARPPVPARPAAALVLSAGPAAPPALPVRPAAVLAPNPTRGQLLLAQASNAPVKTAEREPQQTAGDDRDAESQPGSEEAAPEDAAEEHTPGGLENLVERVNVASDQLEKHWAPVLKGLKDAMVMPGDQAAKLLDSLQTSVSKLEKLAENMKQAHKRFAESQEDGTRADGADKPATAPDAPA